MLLAILSNSKLLGDHLHDLAQYKPAEMVEQKLVTADKSRVLLKRCCNAVGWMAPRDNEYSVGTVFSQRRLPICVRSNCTEQSALQTFARPNLLIAQQDTCECNLYNPELCQSLPPRLYAYLAANSCHTQFL